MPRDLPVGNGNLLVNFDNSYQLRDIYFPNVGQENHTDGHENRLGFWVNGAFAWVDDPEWSRDLRYETDTLVTHVTLRNEKIGLLIICADTVDFTTPIFLRRFTIQNIGSAPADIRVFVHYDWHILEAPEANTVYYDPAIKGLVSYRGERYFIGSGSVGDKIGVASWATGYKEYDNLKGTWFDAEDGALGRYPIAQGAVDGTMEFDCGVVASGDSTIVHHWLTAGLNYKEAANLHDSVVSRSPDYFIERTRNYWKLFVSRQDEPMNGSTEAFSVMNGLPQDIIDEYRRSLLIISTNMNANGAIIAATDGDIWLAARDSYAYMWPRDGALVANALSHSGYGDSTRNFFEFCRNIISHHGYLLHKYTPSGALGSSWHPWSDSNGNPLLPIQEDETALVIYSLWQHYSLFKDIVFIKPLYAPLIKAAADFMVSYIDSGTGLPLPSWDLWEERRGIHAYTIATVHAALHAAAQFAHIFGEHEFEDRYDAAADTVKKAADTYLWNSEKKCFSRMIQLKPDGSIIRDDTMDMAMAALYQYGMYDPLDERIVLLMQEMENRLQIKTSVGGFARYENDAYHKISDDTQNVPGNPWFICTCWAAQYYIACAQTVAELDATIPIMQWIPQHALPSGILAEQVHPYTGEPLSASPLTWSHAEFVETVRWFVGKRRRLQNKTPTA